MAVKVLFISIDGMTDQLGQSQVIPYMEGLSASGHQITILSAEKPHRLQSAGDMIAERLRSSGITWHHVTYHRVPVAGNLLTFFELKKKAFSLHGKSHFQFSHCRSYLPAMIGLALKKRAGLPFLFDMRGFWADERVDGGLWNLSDPLYRAVYRYFKRMEKKLLAEAAAIVTLTRKSLPVLQTICPNQSREIPLSVIPCASDFSHFRLPAPEEKNIARQNLGIPPAAFVLSYLGSLGTWYMLEEMLAFFKELLLIRPDACFLLITKDDPEKAILALQAAKIPVSNFRILSAERKQLPGILAASDWGISFIRPSFSKQASFPTKIAEYFAMGIPVLSNDIGDMDDCIRETGGGLIIREFGTDRLKSAAARMLESAPEPGNIRMKAFGNLGLESAVKKYKELYSRLLP